MTTKQITKTTKRRSPSRSIVLTAERTLGMQLSYPNDIALKKSLEEQGKTSLWKLLKDTHANTTKK